MFAGIRLVLISVVAAAVLVATGAVAEDVRVPHPAIAKGRGDRCVADTDYMRRNHMWTLKHQRDDTVHAGERTGKFGLKQCIDCHTVKGADAQPVSFDSPKHFCRSCHDFTAVRIDCFSCHASRPGDKPTVQNRQNSSDLSTQLREAAQ